VLLTRKGHLHPGSAILRSGRHRKRNNDCNQTKAKMHAAPPTVEHLPTIPRARCAVTGRRCSAQFDN
jgi:hypothetical protein